MLVIYLFVFFVNYKYTISKMTKVMVSFIYANQKGDPFAYDNWANGNS